MTFNLAEHSTYYLLTFNLAELSNWMIFDLAELSTGS